MNSVKFLLAKLRVNLQVGRHNVGHGAGQHNDDEERAVADGFLQSTGKQTGNHHRQGHKGGTKGIMAGLMAALTIIYKV